MTEKITNKIWEFVRGDLGAGDFEKWVYKNNELEDILSKELYLEIISVNYKSKSEVSDLKQKLEGILHESNKVTCQCISLPNTNVTQMGSERDDEVFKTFQQIKVYGEPLSWLYLYECNVCTQQWLMAQDNSQNDINCLKRLTKSEADKIITEDNWPEYFKSYEELLILGKEAGISVSSPGDSSLVHTVVELAKNRPGISVSEIMDLLNVDHELGMEICKKAMSEEKITIQMTE